MAWLVMPLCRFSGGTISSPPLIENRGAATDLAYPLRCLCSGRRTSACKRRCRSEGLDGPSRLANSCELHPRENGRSRKTLRKPSDSPTCVTEHGQVSPKTATPSDYRIYLIPAD